jgi:hypothetical protein
MTENTKMALVVAPIIIIIVVAATIFGDHESHANAAPYSCTAATGEQCFSDLFYADFERFKTLRAQVLAMQKDPDTKALAMAEKSDQLNGMALRLNNEIPKGYAVDEKKLRFVSTAPAVVPQPAPTPVPALGPKK